MATHARSILGQDDPPPSIQKSIVRLRAEVIERGVVPRVYVLEYCEPGELDDRERYWLNLLYRLNTPLTNGQIPGAMSFDQLAKIHG